MANECATAGGDTIERRLRALMEPQSIAIVGISKKEGGVGQQVLRNLQVNAFAGKIHLAGRSGDQIDGLPVAHDIGQLPEGVDLAVLAVPAASVREALSQCIERRVRSAVVFASGFAESGPEGRALQDDIARMVRLAGMPVLGPNCLGFINFITGLRVIFTSVEETPRLPAGALGAVAVVAQSGGVQSHIYRSLVARGVPVSHSVTTGNEMVLGTSDIVQHLLGDEATSTIAVYAEQIADAARFLDAAREARRLGKSVVLLHPGRSAKAREAAQSHTGSMVSNYATMRARLKREGVVFVDSLDECVDMSELLTRYPRAHRGGLGIITFSGAFCGIAHDVSADLGVAVPALAAATTAHLRPMLPAYISPANPLDLGTQVLTQPELLAEGVKSLLADPGIGALLVSIPLSSARQALEALHHVMEGLKNAPAKPLVLLMMNDTAPLPAEFVEFVAAQRIVMWRSADRAIRALGKMLALGETNFWQSRAGDGSLKLAMQTAPGAKAEWWGKQLLARAGIHVPEGGVAKTLDEAHTIAERIGFPLALKAQSESLTHKTEAGAVLLNVLDFQGLSAGWEQLHSNIARSQGRAIPLDGVLVERMSAGGIELIVGAKRDPRWGPMLLVGIGGVLVEALQDVRLVSPEASVEEIENELRLLKGARMLDGFRNLPAVDVAAAASVVSAVGGLIAGCPEIAEIEVNPLMVHPVGQGATALDALVVVACIEPVTEGTC